MTQTWTTEQILALAPDAGSAKAGKDLAAPRRWHSLGRSEQALWGECQGSGASPYRTQIDLSEPAFRCSCPSRKFPCKHALGIFLLLAGQPSAFAATEPPEWVTEWLTSRGQRAQQRVERAARAEERSGEASDPDAQARRAEEREVRVAAGLAELERWLRDRVRHGLATLEGEPDSLWEGLAARLVDAQAPGVARLLREIPEILGSGAEWQERLLARFGRLFLLIEGAKRLQSLPEETRADLRALIGWTQPQEELLRAGGVRDRWRVVGQRLAQEARLRTQSIWFWGCSSGRAALLFHFAHASQPLETRFPPGAIGDAEIVFHPGAYPLRAVVKRWEPSTNDEVRGDGGSGYTSVSEALAAYGAGLARNAWLEAFPMLLAAVLPVRRGEEWAVRDTEGALLPLPPRFSRGWQLLAISGGQPLSLFGEWDGEMLRPLSVWSREGFVALG
jgi:hypothetical protein